MYKRETTASADPETKPGVANFELLELTPGIFIEPAILSFPQDIDRRNPSTVRHVSFRNPHHLSPFWPPSRASPWKRINLDFAVEDFVSPPWNIIHPNATPVLPRKSIPPPAPGGLYAVLSLWFSLFHNPTHSQTPPPSPFTPLTASCTSP